MEHVRFCTILSSKGIVVLQLKGVMAVWAGFEGSKIDTAPAS